MMPWRSRLGCVMVLLLLLAVLLLGRLFDLTLWHRAFLLHQGQQRHLRVMNVPGDRGMILDRWGDPLAVSTLTVAVWANPSLVQFQAEQLPALASVLQMSPVAIQKRLQLNAQKSFVYLKRGLPPVAAQQLKDLAVSGIFTIREPKRFYPQGQVTAHVVGLADIDDHGQEGLELGMDRWLQGRPGKKMVLKDRLGHVISDIETVRMSEPGQDVRLSVDHRLQYLAYQVLTDTVAKYHAHSGSAVILDVKTGEVLAMVNAPSYNPNHRPKVADGRFRNRAMTDVFEPGSTFKALTVIAALESGQFNADTPIDTAPGYMMLNGKAVREVHGSLGVLTVTQALQRSSNVAMAKMVLATPRDRFVQLLSRMGVGRPTQTVFPGEVAGRLPDLDQMRDIDLASLSFGYGVSLTPLQLASVYAVIANHGEKVPITFLRRDHWPSGQQVVSPKVADQVLHMLERVTAKGGTGYAARVSHYRVAGKTGTAQVATRGGYDATRHVASFVGMAPVSDPELVVAVVVREPEGKKYYGSQVAAPAFASIMSGALRLIDSTPDDLAVHQVVEEGVHD